MDKHIILDEVVKIIDSQKDKYKFGQDVTADGRNESANKEKEIIDTIKTHYLQNPDIKVIIPDAKLRSFIDLKIVIQKTKEININIKITKGNNAADNANATKAILWVFSNLSVNEISHNTSQKIKALAHSSNIETNRDYYYIVVFKDRDKNTIWTSLRMLNKLRANGNNPPFQINWNENHKRVTRTYKEAKRFILSKYMESLKLQIESYSKIIDAINQEILK